MTGWHILGYHTGFQYVDWAVMHCPSMDSKYYTKPAPYPQQISLMLDYDFRYNSFDTCAAAGMGATPPYPRNRLDSASLATSPLFTDAGELRRTRPGGVIITAYQQTDYWDRRWAHETGGNMVMHDGSARWVTNALRPSSWEGWPSSYGVAFSFYDTLVR
jgi:hypothetical protein